ncbi:MAG: endo alpha-1,4 polygalactosaminidase, partial [Hyphomicrobiaceae bacterium]|nr:endo alpha-1,4 polygalactosaminidase [Hyphomicrobiaceae bacterium]
EAEDYRPDYFTPEYMTEDAPDWLLSENERWKGNRRIRFCEEGWQRTILGDDDGRSVYNSIEPSPLYRLIEAGFDGVYLDRVDVYSEVEDQCPDAARQMVAFVARLAAHARKKNPNFIVILQNAEELLARKEMVNVIDAVAKEDLFYGADHTERANAPAMVNETLKNLKLARDAGRPVFVLDYLKDPAKRAADKAKIEAQGFIPYFGPRPLDVLWFAHASH